MNAYVGTSGWLYSWNEGRTLEWYVRNSGLNAIELNSSFYRFPRKGGVSAWKDSGANLSWAIKVNRAITHRFKLNKNSYVPFARFKRLFAPLNKHIRFYLFQLPPMLTTNLLDNLEKFQRRFGLGDRFALEARNRTWFNEDAYKRVKELGITMVSVDSPQGTFIMKTGKTVYLRLHGRRGWYNYRYSERELADLARGVAMLKPKNTYAFFNNDHSMLLNARMMLRALGRR